VKSERDREVVQRTAELLTSSLTLEQLFDAVCSLLARFVDASKVFVAIKEGESARFAFVLEDGIASTPAENRRVHPASRTAQVMRTGEPVLKRRLEDWTEGRFTVNPATAQTKSAISAIFVPLKFGAEIIGVLSVQSPEPDAYDEGDVALLQTCALYLSVRIHQAQLESRSARLANIASTDSLTGVANRRSFNQRFPGEWRRAIRRSSSLALIIVDIDFFKAFNDTYGHVAGDAALQQVATALASCLSRSEDFFARYGGEEFVAILPDTTLSGALTIAERMREAAAALNVAHSGSLLQRLTVSCGVACKTPARGSLPETLVAAADAALYQAKRTGRNRVAAENYRSDTPAAYPSKAHRHNLPDLRGESAGRGAELLQIRKMLRGCRLLTIAGPAGMGKSHSAIAAAARELSRFPDGVFYVDCSSVTESGYFWNKVALTLGVPESAFAAAGFALSEHLQLKRALLILDNCEHIPEVISACVRVLVSETRDVRVLITRREPLMIPGESAYVLPPLKIDEAVELFSIRSAAARGGVPSSEEAESVERICLGLDGVPRAIELTAAQSACFPLAELADRLPDRAELGREALRGFVKWSYEVLPQIEQQLLREVSVFAGGARAGAIAMVCSDDTRLQALVDKGLLTVEFSGSGERYVMPAAIKQLGMEQLRARAEWENVSMRHARYFAQRARELASSRSTPRWSETLAQLLPENENFRAALVFTVSQGNDVRLGAEISADLVEYWQHLGRNAAGREWLEQMLARENQPYDKALRAKMLLGVASLETSRSKRTLDAALEAVGLYRELGDDLGLASALFEVGAAWTGLGDWDGAESYLQEALEIAQRAQDKRRTADVLNLIGLAHNWRGDTVRARVLLEQSLSLFRELEDDRGVASMLGNLGDLAASSGDYDEAVALTRQSLAILERVHDVQSTAWQLVNLGAFELKRGDRDAARPALRRALELLREYQDDWLAANCLDALARLAVAEQDWGRALRLAGFADSVLDAMGVPRQPPDQLDYEDVVREATAAIGAADAKRELECARTLGWPDAVKEAVKV
jgi:diguanylate cyclase (GGDEF)-like protein